MNWESKGKVLLIIVFLFVDIKIAKDLRYSWLQQYWAVFKSKSKVLLRKTLFCGKVLVGAFTNLSLMHLRLVQSQCFDACSMKPFEIMFGFFPQVLLDLVQKKTEMNGNKELKNSTVWSVKSFYFLKSCVIVRIENWFTTFIRICGTWPASCLLWTDSFSGWHLVFALPNFKVTLWVNKHGFQVYFYGKNRVE